MDIPADIPIRAKRLADGDLHIEDVRKLFKWARSVLKPGDPVRDVGDFDAHPERREKGLTWEIGRAFCAILRMGALGEVAGVKVTAQDVKVSLLSCITFAYQANDPKQSGFSNEKLIAAIKSIAGKVNGFNNGKATFSSKLNGDEDIVYNYISSRRSVPLAFTSFSITKSLFELLVQHKILEVQRRADFYKATCFINVFIVSVMHLAVIDLKGIPGSAKLLANTSSTHYDKIVIHMHYVVPEFPRMLGSVRVYASDCNASDWVSPSLHSSVMGPVELLKDWDIPLEIGGDGKLHPLAGVEVKEGAIRPMPGVTVY